MRMQHTHVCASSVAAQTHPLGNSSAQSQLRPGSELSSGKHLLRLHGRPVAHETGRQVAALICDNPATLRVLILRGLLLLLLLLRRLTLLLLLHRWLCRRPWLLLLLLPRRLRSRALRECSQLSSQRVLRLRTLTMPSGQARYLRFSYPVKHDWCRSLSRNRCR